MSSKPRPLLTLYYKPTCPHCQKVQRFMEQQGIKFPEKDISSSPELYKELISIGGKSQVPCLLINGQALYESNDIIRWLQENYEDKR